MRIITHRQYDKAWTKLDTRQQKRVLAALKLWMIEPYNSKLRLHRLQGKYYPQYSISAGGDLRVHFLQPDDNYIVLILV